MLAEDVYEFQFLIGNVLVELCDHDHIKWIGFQFLIGNVLALQYFCEAVL